MDAKEIKEELALKSISLSDIARKFGCTPSNIHQIIGSGAGNKDGLPSIIRSYIAKSIGKNYDSVWV